MSESRDAMILKQDAVRQEIKRISYKAGVHTINGGGPEAQNMCDIIISIAERRARDAYTDAVKELVNLRNVLQHIPTPE